MRAVKVLLTRADAAVYRLRYGGWWRKSNVTMVM